MERFTVDIISAGILDNDASWRWDSQGEQDGSFVLWIISSGRGTLIAGDVRYDLSRGDCLISSMASSHYGRQDPKNLLTIPWFLYTYRNEKGKRFVPSPLPRCYRKIQAPHFIEMLVTRAAEAYRDKAVDDSRIWAKAALIEIERLDKSRMLAGPKLEQYRLIERIAADIRKNPGETKPLKYYAESMYCTLDHFIRLFRLHMNVTPGEFIVRSRIDKAEHLLKYSSYQIKKIADILGFGDIHHFSAQFKKRVGVSPTKYRDA